MDTNSIISKFEDLGARVKISPQPRRWGSLPRPLSLDVGRDSRGEFFDLYFDDRQVESLDALDVRPRERHLLLLARIRAFNGRVRFKHGQRWNSDVAILPPLSQSLEKPRYLCGHDERHWFVAAVPEDAHASNVRIAMEALKPEAVLRAQDALNVRSDRRNRRKNPAFIRQGEWFFLPRPDILVPQALIRQREPLQRSGGKAHWAQFAYRTGGETVYVSRAFPSGLLPANHREHLARHPEAQGTFAIMRRNAALYVRGRISHADHATVVLQGWHEVVMNTENRAKARKDVVFLD